MWASLFKWGSDTSGCYFILEHLLTFFFQNGRETPILCFRKICPPCSRCWGWISVSIASLKRKLIHEPGQLGQDASSVEHDPMPNINMTFFQANFSGYYSTHSLMLEIPVCPLHTFPNSQEIFICLMTKPKSLMIEQGRLNTFLGGMSTTLMLCLDSTLPIWLKDYWYIRVLQWSDLLLRWV
jgi:hypothetical protein